MDKEAKKSKDKKWSKNKLERADDLASRMMASKDFEGDWSSAFALSRWMENKGYDVKKKPSKPHKEYIPKDKAAMEALHGLNKLAEDLDVRGLYKEADMVTDIMKKIAQSADDSMVKQYVETALWSSNDENGEPLDRNYDAGYISPDVMRRAQEDCNRFVQMAGSLLDGLDMSRVGHDFWLTRNRHGAGFWDGDYEPEIGKQLTEIAHKFDEQYWYVGDDGYIHDDIL